MEQIYTGDALEILRQMPDQSVNMCVTSPPYYGLRDYGVSGQLGLEKTPEAYVGAMVEVMREVRRVLCDDGTLWINIGDSWATRSGNAPPSKANKNVHGHTAKTCPAGYKAKDIIGIPWMLAFALRADGWYLRQDIIWAKPNCMPESVRDRCTKSHEYIFLLSKLPRYYFDAAAIAEPVADRTAKKLAQDVRAQRGSMRAVGKTNDPMHAVGNGATRHKRDVWMIPTSTCKSKHIAVYPPALVRPCILAGSRPGDTVLDPFAGSGTTAVVSRELGRHSVNIDINPAYTEIMRQRLLSAE